MLKPGIGFCLEGLPIIIWTFLATIVFALLEWNFLAILGLAASLFVLNFFRDPQRVVPQEHGLAVAPADGKVVKVEKMTDPFSGQEKTAICIFMNVFNVHVNRSPVTGQVEGIKYFPGKFINASLDKASKDNERNAILLKDKEGEFWTVVQIAGLIARRIVCWVEHGDHLHRGERLGMIKFGSRVDLYLPDGYEPLVKINDKVFAGQSIVARKKA
ncbi:phosphatidylserine decarboxylase family protein [Desulfohalobiaceae bacterium Ax17]|uniref:phosphatidylserine decarboxylase family protein n=1 Tax=Desulfovulcanus ferrireducens TaxID=2831190 RepID=UPI00207BC12E|nr:phosphatidylserine decarboxylase family protein [Desulfovulcanus ferrireducens]MBT8762969.1 phosphatidylserine decarboxylase family protein [Desulfovulcanus ferrireducens]